MSASSTIRSTVHAAVAVSLVVVSRIVMSGLGVAGAEKQIIDPAKSFDGFL